MKFGQKLGFSYICFVCSESFFVFANFLDRPNALQTLDYVVRCLSVGIDLQWIFGRTRCSSQRNKRRSVLAQRLSTRLFSYHRSLMVIFAYGPPRAIITKRGTERFLSMERTVTACRGRLSRYTYTYRTSNGHVSTNQPYLSSQPLPSFSQGISVKLKERKQSPSDNEGRVEAGILSRTFVSNY